jgi:biotin carboxylase
MAGAMPSRVLLVGSSFSAAPIFACLKERGLHITVCGRHEGDPCHQYADASSFIDYSNKDDLLQLVERGDFDAIIPTCNDFSYISCAFVASKTGHRGFDDWTTTNIIHTKALFRAFCAEHSIAAPRAVSGPRTASASDWLAVMAQKGMGWPILIKPVDSFSGRGVTRLACDDGLGAAIARAQDESRTGEILIEEFGEGSLHSHSAFVENGSIVWDTFVDEYCTVYPYQVNCSHSPSLLPEHHRQFVRAEMNKVIRAGKLADGLLHTQFIAETGRIWIIESMRRCPGDLYNRLIERATGFRYTDWYARKFLGEPYPDVDAAGVQRFIGRHTVSIDSEWIVSGIDVAAGFEDVCVVPLKGSAEKLYPAPGDKYAIAFVRFASADQMSRVAPRLKDFIRPIVLESIER